MGFGSSIDGIFMPCLAKMGDLSWTLVFREGRRHKQEGHDYTGRFILTSSFCWLLTLELEGHLMIPIGRILHQKCFTKPTFTDAIDSLIAFSTTFYEPICNI